MVELLISEGSRNITNAIKGCGKEIYSKYISCVIFVKDLVSIILEYLDTKGLFQVWFRSCLVRKYTSLFSIDIIEGDTTLIVEDVQCAINIIHKHIDLPKLKDDVVKTSWLKNYDVVENISEARSLTSIYTTSFIIENSTLPYDCDVLILEPTDEKITIITDLGVLFSSPFKTPIYLITRCYNLCTLVVVGKVKIKKGYLDSILAKKFSTSTIEDDMCGFFYFYGFLTNDKQAKEEILNRPRFIPLGL